MSYSLLRHPTRLERRTPGLQWSFDLLMPRRRTDGSRVRLDRRSPSASPEDLHKAMLQSAFGRRSGLLLRGVQVIERDDRLIEQPHFGAPLVGVELDKRGEDPEARSLQIVVMLAPRSGAELLTVLVESLDPDHYLRLSTAAVRGR
jgi:hypothetical protein